MRMPVAGGIDSVTPQPPNAAWISIVANLHNVDKCNAADHSYEIAT
jgi:hypothetical protein